MKTLTLEMSDSEFEKYDFENKGTLTLNEFIKKIKIKQGKNALERSLSISKQYGLDAISDEEINYEIKKVLNDKNHN